MKLTDVDVNKKEEYEAELAHYLQKYKDKKSELKWADDEFEESLLQEEMEVYAKKVRGLKKILAQIEENDQQVA